MMEGGGREEKEGSHQRCFMMDSGGGRMQRLGERRGVVLRVVAPQAVGTLKSALVVEDAWS